MRTLFLPALLCLSAACSSNGGTSSGGAGGANACPGNLVEAANSEFCAGDKSTINCALVGADRTQVCGVPMPAPTTELQRSANVKEFAGTGAPDVACYQSANYPKGGTSMPVTMSGTARIFAHGCASTDLTIEVYTVKRTGDDHDGELDQLVGTSVVTPSDCTATSTMSTTSDCSPRYECQYSYPNVPSETELAVKTYGAKWAALYDYNIYIANAAVTNGTYSHNVRALDAGDYGVIAQAALGAPITAGNGAIAGEVHDCGDVRLIGATVDVNVGRKLLTYFTTDESNPLPDTSASSSTALGLYAALDVAPGPASVAALGMVGGQVTTVGYYKVRVFPDSVTSITFSGVRPYQITQ